MFTALFYIGVGFVLGAAFPGVLRVIRKWFQDEAEQIKPNLPKF